MNARVIAVFAAQANRRYLKCSERILTAQDREFSDTRHFDTSRPVRKHVTPYEILIKFYQKNLEKIVLNFEKFIRINSLPPIEIE